MADPEQIGDAYVAREQQRERDLIDAEIAADFDADRVSAAAGQPLAQAPAQPATPPELRQPVQKSIAERVAELGDGENEDRTPGELPSTTGQRVGTAVAKGVTTTIADAPLVVGGAIVDAAQGALDATYTLSQVLPGGDITLGDLANALVPGQPVDVPEKPDPIKLFDIKQPRSDTGKALRAMGEFVVGFFPAMRAVQAVGVPTRGGQALAAGALTDMTLFAGNEANLANFLQQFPELRNPVTAYLAAPVGEELTAFEDLQQRVKNAVPGAVAGGMLDATLQGLKVIREARRARAVAEGKLPATELTKEAEPTPLGDRSARLVREVDPTVRKTPGGTLAVKLPSEDDLARFDPDVGLGGIPDRAININLRRIDAPEDIRNAIAQVGEIYEERFRGAARGVVPHEQTQRLAAELGLTPEELLSRQRGQVYNAHEMLAARQIMVSSASNLRSLAAIARAPNAGAQDQLAFQNAFAVHAALQEQITGATAEAGRALQAFRIPVGAEGESAAMLNEALMGAARGRIDRHTGEVLTTSELADMVLALDDRQGLHTFVRQAQGATKGEMLLEAWINGLLSGPTTHMVNITSNALVKLWMIPERMLAGGINSIDAALGGTKEIYASESSRQVYSMVAAQVDAFRALSKALIKNEPIDPTLLATERRRDAITARNLGRDPNSAWGRGWDMAGQVARLPGRFLNAEDSYFKLLGYRMELHAQAYRSGVAQGLEGRALAEHIAGVIRDPPASVSGASWDQARVETFTNALGRGGQGFQTMLNEMPAMRVVFPFVRTPVNILKFVGVRSPLAPLSRNVRQDIAAGGARRASALARIGLGSGFMGTAMQFAATGQITGGPPADPQLRAALRTAGDQPYSVRIPANSMSKAYENNLLKTMPEQVRRIENGDVLISYSRTDPLGLTLGIAADLHKVLAHIEDGKNEELAAAVIMSLSENLVNKTYLRGLATFVETMASVSPELGASKADRLVGQLLGSLIPTGFAQTARAIDPTLRETRGYLDYIMARIPGLSSGLPARRNYWGEPIDIPGGFTERLLSPFYRSIGKPTEVDQEIIRLGGVPQHPTSIDGVRLDTDMNSRFRELIGKDVKLNPDTGQISASGVGLHRRLEMLMDTAEYKRRGPDAQRAAIMRIAGVYRQQAQRKLREEFPELDRALTERQALDLSGESGEPFESAIQRIQQQVP